MLKRKFEFKIKHNRIDYDYNYHYSEHFNGLCYLSPNKKFSYVNIPKNASTTLSVMFSNWNFSDFNKFADIDQPNYLVVLRDPVDRWISGMTHYLWKLNKKRPEEEILNLLTSQSFQNLIFDFMVFENHTLPQICFLSGLRLDKTTFFYFSTGVVSKIQNFINDVSLVSPGRLCEHLAWDVKAKMYNKLKSLINGDSEVRSRITQQYSADYQLIDTVKFYN